MTDEQMMALAQTYQTPMHIFDMAILKKRVAFLKSHLPEQVSLCYAVKANTFIIKELCGQVERFEVCSPGELAICRRLQIPMRQVVLSGVYKTPAVMEALFRDGVDIGIFTAESMEQYLLLAGLAERYTMKIRLLLRLTSGNQFGMDQKTIGFNADIRDKRDYNIGDVLKHALPQDFVKFGLIPEFIGRVPVTVSLDMLDRDALIRILQEPKNALTKQYQKLFELDGVALAFDKEAHEAIADKALERKTGARGLREIMEAVTLDLMYHIPSAESITQCQITTEMVDEQLAIEERKIDQIEAKQVG